MFFISLVPLGLYVTAGNKRFNKFEVLTEAALSPVLDTDGFCISDVRRSMSAPIS
jgi:hypothetical protein